MLNNKKLNIGIIGGGIIGKNTSGLYNTDKSIVTDVLRRDPSKAKEFGKEIHAKSHSAPMLLKEEIESMLKQPFDLAVLTMIPGVQRDIAIQCAEHGKPLYVEKMFAGNYQNAQEVVQAYKNKNLPLFIAHFCRCMPQIQFVKKILMNNIIGKVKSIQMNVDRVYNENALENKKWMQDPNLAGGGWFADLGPHYVDALIYLFGDLEIIESRIEQTFPKYKNLEDRVQLAFETMEGISGRANFDFNSDKWSDNVIVEGENGSISFKVLGRDAPVIVTHKDGQIKCVEFKNDSLMQAPMIRQIINTLYDYKYANKTLEQIEKEALTNGLCSGQEALKSSVIISNIISKFHKQIDYSKQRNNFLSSIDARNRIVNPLFNTTANQLPKTHTSNTSIEDEEFEL